MPPGAFAYRLANPAAALSISQSTTSFFEVRSDNEGSIVCPVVLPCSLLQFFDEKCGDREGVPKFVEEVIERLVRPGNQASIKKPSPSNVVHPSDVAWKS
jgi:hypothetical protein